VHAASVGETLAALPLIAELTARGPTVLLTTGTVTAARVAGQRLPASAIHQFAPIDTPGAVDRFLRHWRPDLVLFAESELWPTSLGALDRRGVPLVVVNARLSERSAAGWRRVAPLARAVFNCVELWLAQSEADAARLAGLGARRVEVCGNLKFDAPPPPADMSEVARLRATIGDRFVLAAASTHPGEEAAVVGAHRQLARTGPRPLTILAPRHPDRGDALAAEIGAGGLAVQRRSTGDPIALTADIYLADTIGEMGLWFRLADAAFLGGSLVPHGGQNPIEAAKLAVPVLHGRHVGNFRDIYEALGAAGAAQEVDDVASLAAALAALRADPEARAGMARAATACIARSTGALARTLAALDPHLARLTAAP